MNIVRKDLDALNATLTFNIVKSDYEEKVNKAIKDYSKKVNMPGFRPGKVPAGLIKKQFGTQLLVDEINKMVSEELYKYIKDNNINILGDPLASENQKDVNFATDEEFEFSFDLGLAPEVDAKVDGKTKIAYYNIKLDDKMVDDQIKSYASRFGKYSPADAVEENDVIKGNVVELESAKKEKEGGVVVEGVILSPKYMKDEKNKKAFIGAKVGDVVKFNPKKAYDNNDVEVASLLKKTKDEVADIKSDFNFTVTEITRYTEAEINQELFDKVLGKDAVKSEADFKEKIKEDIKKTLVDDADYKFAQDARKALIKKNEKVAFPEAFLKRWALTTNKDLTQEKLDADFPAMLDELKWHLVQEKIAKENDIKVEDGDIEEFAKKVAKSQFAQYGMTNVPDEILNGYVADMKKDQKAIQNMVNGVINEKINGIIKNAAKLDEKEISLDDFNKLLQDEK